MDSQSLILCMSYGNSKKLISYEIGMTLPNFLLFIKEEFSIGDKEIKLTEIRRNAEITSPRCLKEEEEYSIEESENNLDNQINSAPPNNSSDLNQSNGNGTRIDYNDIKNNKYHKNELQDQINVWANKKKIYIVTLRIATIASF